MQKVKAGIIGCGNISEIYIKNCSEVFDILEVCERPSPIPSALSKNAYGV
jgi:hypothetical protein